MPTYLQLESESWWRLEYEPPPLARFNQLLRDHSGLSRNECGSKGDNYHLNGRHRSRSWDLNSQFCTNRGYATTDSRDKAGPGNALRATDYGLTGPALWAACRNLDAAVRAGRLPELAEWFGTFDGKTVVGWSNGRPATSDSSHLIHLHLGYWTAYVENTDFFDRLLAVLTGDDMPLTESDVRKVWNNYEARNGLNLADNLGQAAAYSRQAAEGVAALTAVIEHLAEAIRAGGGSVDTAAILAGVDVRLAAVNAEIRDAVADLGEGGAVQVRADAS